MDFLLKFIILCLINELAEGTYTYISDIGHINSTLTSPCNLPSGFDIEINLKCDLDAAADLNFAPEQISNLKECKLAKYFGDTASFIAKPWSHFILTQATTTTSFNYSNILSYYWENFNKPERLLHTFRVSFQFMHGFQINAFHFNSLRLQYRNTTKKSKVLSTLYLNLEFHKSKFDLYDDNERKLETCQDLATFNKSMFEKMTSNNNNFTILNQIVLNKCEYTHKICPLVFRNSQLFLFEIDKIIKSYLKTNMFWFTSSSNLTNLNSNVRTFKLKSVENIDLDVNLIDPIVFRNMEFLRVSGQLDRIQVDVFKPFRILKNSRFKIKKYAINFASQWDRVDKEHKR